MKLSRRNIVAGAAALPFAAGAARAAAPVTVSVDASKSPATIPGRLHGTGV